jgi:hypothetical protein
MNKPTRLFRSSSTDVHGQQKSPLDIALPPSKLGQAAGLCLVFLAIVSCGRSSAAAVESPEAREVAESATRDRKGSAGWTKEKIAADPIGYIDWSLAELDRLENKLKGHRLAADAVDIKFKRETAADAALSAARKTQLADMIEVYKVHEKSGTWPAKFRGVPVDQAKLKRLILDTSASLQQSEARAGTAPHVAVVAGKQSRDVDEQLAHIQAQRARLIEARRLMELNRDVSQLNSLVQETNELIDLNEAVARVGKVEAKSGDFMPTAQEVTDEDRLNQILGK